MAGEGSTERGRMDLDEQDGKGMRNARGCIKGNTVHRLLLFFASLLLKAFLSL